MQRWTGGYGHRFIGIITNLATNEMSLTMQPLFTEFVKTVTAAFHVIQITKNLT
jgi:hypothetical protein